MRLVSFADENEAIQSMIILSRQEAFRLMHHLMEQLEKATPLESFNSNAGEVYFAVRSDEESKPD